MTKRLLALFLAASLALCLFGCGTAGAEPEENGAKPDDYAGTQDVEGTDAPEDGGEVPTVKGAGEEVHEPEEEEETTPFSFAELKDLEFWFLSGAGGWATTMRIQEDGSFSGLFHDSNMGDTGEGYPNGTLYWSEFTGRFAEPVKVNDYTYSVGLEELNYPEEYGTEEIRDGTLYCYGDAYGLTGTETFLIYRPGAPLAELSEEFRSWIGYYDLSRTTDTELPFYALCNEAQQQGFSGRRPYDPAEELREKLRTVEEQVEQLEKELREDSLSQGEMNEKSGEIYQLWDTLLNEIWAALKENLDEETMKELTVQEREWIAEKEKAVTEAGAEFGEGSLRLLIESSKAAEMTKDRVYVLLDLLEQ